MKITKEKLVRLEELVESINLSKGSNVLTYTENKLKGDRRYISYVLDTLQLGKVAKESKNTNKQEQVVYKEDDMVYTLSKSSRGDYFLTRTFIEEELNRSTDRVILLRKSTKKKLDIVENKTARTIKNILKTFKREHRGFGL